jgi:hypothetical protein
MKKRPWRLCHIFGIGNKKGNVRPWNLLDGILIIFAHENERAHVLWDDFSAEYLQELVDKLVPLTYGFTVLYIFSLLTLILVGMTILTAMLREKGSESGVHMNGNGVTKHKTA